MPGRLEGRIALVSGSAQGFGRGILETLFLKADVVSEASWKKPVKNCVCLTLCFYLNGSFQLETSVARFGDVPSIVVHNAGWAYLSKSGLEVTIEEFERVFDINAKSIFMASKILVPEMRRNGPGLIIVISSENVFRPGHNQTWYSASKAAVSSATKSLVLEFAKDQLRFNTVCPTSGNTPLLSTFAGKASGPVTKDIIQAKGAAIPIGRIAEPSDVANAALFLADPASSLISGAEIRVDGAHSV
ncbi:hypothetical protein ACKAV7_010880 [Fusarium commune]